MGRTAWILTGGGLALLFVSAFVFQGGAPGMGLLAAVMIVCGLLTGLWKSMNAAPVVNTAGQMYCQNCGTVRWPVKRTRGSFAIEIILWFCFFIPGLIYTVWRLTTKELVCPECGATGMIPLTSPKAVAALSEK